MECNIACPFFLTVNHGHYVTCSCRLDQDSNFDQFWKFLDSSQKECIHEEQRIIKMEELLGFLNE